MRFLIAALCLACSPAFAEGDEIKKCWNVGYLSAEATRTMVFMSFIADENGIPDAASIRMISFKDGSKAGAKQACDAARRAIIRCGATGFQSWAGREVELSFSRFGIFEIIPPRPSEI